MNQPTKFKYFQAYQEAAQIDQQITDLLKKYPPTKENGIQWLNLTRTMRTSITIIEEMILEMLLKT